MKIYSYPVIIAARRYWDNRMAVKSGVYDQVSQPNVGPISKNWGVMAQMAEKHKTCLAVTMG